VLLATFIIVSFPGSSLAQRVRDLHQNLTLAANGQLAVAESVTVDFGKAGPASFYRRIATLYKRSGRLCSLAIYVKSISDGSGQKLAYTTKNMQGYENIVIGSGKKPLTGLHVFKLNYDVIDSVNFVSGKPELFYSVLGREWSWPIDKVAVSLTLAANQTEFAGRTVGYVGNFGSRRRAHSRVSPGLLSVGTEKLLPGQDLIVVLPLPPGSVTASGWPDVLSEIYQTSQMAVLLPAGTLVALIVMWLLIGSDQHFGKVPDFHLGAPWQPPRELTPAEVGTMVDESCDDKDIVATIFDLASRGYLTIREVTYHGLIGYGSKDYEFSQPPQPVKGDLKEHEQLILNAIFTGRNKSYLSDMHGYLFDYMPILRKEILTGLAQDKFFARNPQSDRDYFVSTASCVLALGASLYAYSVFGADTYKITSYGVIISGLFIFFAAGVMPKRTRKGVAAIDQCHLFEHFILHADDRDIEAAFNQDPTVFYSLLPYTVVLGMAEYWAERFKHLVKDYPLWYFTIEQVEGDAQKFDTAKLVQEILACMKAVRHMATTRPEHKADASSHRQIRPNILP